ncbi:MAG: imidazolonepropionase [Rhodospirillaceae bacterium]|nr:imidazolonepropionase [Rhodospirillaceae bacterium]
MWDALWLNGSLATMAGDGLGAIADGAVAVSDGKIVWAGARSDLGGAPNTLARTVNDLGGAWLTPGLIDCHTHLVHAGDRAREFALRMAGASYEEIARAGGGILSTVAATRAADVDELARLAAPRLASLMAEGVTTVEIKSGYGLTTASEAAMLRAAAQAAAAAGLRLHRSFLGAHTIPPEYAQRPDEYVARICYEMLPLVAEEGLADSVDAFVERIAFTPAQVARVFEAATRLGLPVRLHADQITDQGGAALAAQFKALSADHLEHTSPAGVAAMAAAGTVAVMLPGAYYCLRDTRMPPIAAFREHGVPMAVATDCNPGTSPLFSLLTAMNMASVLFRMTATEVLRGVTCVAARVLGLGEVCGRIAPGLAADFAIWRVGDLAELPYRIGFNPLVGTVVAGHPRARARPHASIAGTA